MSKKERWNSMWENKQTHWDIGSPSTPLVAYIDQIKDKTIEILIPGAGNAYEAEYLHKKGFPFVKVLDISALPVKKLLNRYPDFPKENVIEGDFFAHSGTYDLILEQTFFSAIEPDQREDYMNQVYHLLKPKGRLVGVLFGIPMFDNGPPYGGQLDHYKALFQKKFILQTLEPCYNSIKPRMGSELFVNFQRK
jgi:SAM-dependent methyltransferase